MNRWLVIDIVVGSILWFLFQLPIWLILLILLGVYAATPSGYEYLYVFVKTIHRDHQALVRYAKTLFRLKYLERNNLTVPRIFDQLVKNHPNKACLIFENKEWSFKMVDEFSNKIAHIFEEAGFKKGDSVALLLDNRLEYVPIWLGLAKAGVVTALINYNLRDKPLLHSIQIVESKAVIFGADFTQALDDVRSQLDPSVKLYAFDFGKSGQVPAGTINLDALLDEASPGPLSGPQRSNYNEKMLYIYTSGTTGLPKAAEIRHSRFAFLVVGTYFLNCLRHSDILYITLPLYHTNGGLQGIGMVVLFGATAVIRKKFSASAFWTEAARHNCTVSQYIGEICRYLLAQPPHPEDATRHKIRLMFGNGLRPLIWEQFVTRFNIQHIGEIYGATEGNANIINFDGTVGAIGFVSLILPSFYPVGLIKVTDDTGEPIRGKDGLCIRCKPGEPGMFVGKIIKNHPSRDFHGYADKSATQKKVAHDVFERGDAAFLSGDILEMDRFGYLYFKDRTGDTFRWRGENVSTTEVEYVINKAAGLSKDCCVYGVEVPGSEGRASMVAILDAQKNLDLALLAQEVSKVLPVYARPLFVRLVSSIDLTGTYKLRKVDYQKEGINPALIKDPIYFFDSASQSYVLFTQELHEKLVVGKLRV